MEKENIGQRLREADEEMTELEQCKMRCEELEKALEAELKARVGSLYRESEQTKASIYGKRVEIIIKVE